MASKRATRVTKSCSECQRRKQKCSREWPCNHCRARKIPQLCNFGAIRPGSEPQSAGPGVSVGEGSELPPPAQAADQHAGTEIEPFADDIDIIEDLSKTSLYDVPLRSTGPYEKLQKEAIQDALQILPPRQLLDLLVQDFVTNSNYHQYTIHPPTFLEHYVQWWYANDHGLRLDPRFTCLLIRVCSFASLYVPPDLQQLVESELAKSMPTLADQLHEVAQRLSMTITPGQGGLMQVQQLFLACLWLKAQAMFVDSWHALGAAVREAQELGMHQISPNKQFSDFETELRTRMWWLLYSWDWQMSSGVSRPFLIDQCSCTVRRPNLLADESDSADGLPSPFAHMALLGDLVQELAEEFNRLDEALNATQVMQFLKHVDDWLESIPACFHYPDPDTTWDESHPYIVHQRWQTNIGARVVKILPLKPYLMKPITTESSMQDLALRAEAIECCLTILDVSFEKLDELLPKIPKQHVSTFTIFDTTVFLCSAVMHDRLASLPQADKVFAAIHRAIKTMEKLAYTSSLGPKPFQLLKKLAENLSIISLDTSNSDDDDVRATKRTRVAEFHASGGVSPMGHVQAITNASDLHSPGAEWQLWQDALHGTLDLDEDFDPEHFFFSDS